MRKLFSRRWVGSSQPRKQRKHRYNAPLHVRHKFLNAHLSKDLRTKHGIRATPVRVGDEVLIMRGSFAGKKAKVNRVDLTYERVYLESITRTKRDGSKVAIPVRPNALSIVSLAGDDKKRLKSASKTSEKSHAPKSS